jgi:tetratricopeptide (TPR) repeat protein
MAAGLAMLGMLSFVQATHWSDNETLFQHTLTVNPQSSVGHNNWGVALIKRGQYSLALPHLEIALKQDEKSPKARLNYALALQSLGNVEAAIQQYQTGLQDHPDDSDVRSNLGAAYFALGRFEQAIEQYQHALRLQPRSPIARFNLALAYDRLGKPQQAIAELEELLARYPVHYQARMKLGTLLESQGQRHAALGQLRAAVERFPNKPEARLELAMVLAANGQPREALEQYFMGMREDSPHWHWLAGGAALVLAAHPDKSLRNGPEAVRLAEAACQRTGFQAPALLQALAAAYAETGDFRRAAEVARTAMQRAGNDELFAAELSHQLGLYEQEKTWNKKY